MPLYIDGAATPAITRRIEEHLLDCGRCRARLVRMRDAKRLLERLPSIDAPAFARAPMVSPAMPRRSFPRSRLLRHFAVDALVAATLFAAFTLLYTHAASAGSRLYDFSAFEPVDLHQIASTHDPHVVVQGVVSDIAGNFENEGRRRFRLSDPRDPAASVVCEILDGDSVAAPKAGTRVRVWGVTRFDSNPAHRWYEIHPVLKMEVVR
jgi:hypothetical protein